MNFTRPLASLSRYSTYVAISETSHEFIFRSISFCKHSNSNKLITIDKNLSNTKAREKILSALCEVGLDISKFCLHSLGSRCSTAAAAADIQDRLLKNTAAGRVIKLKMVM